MRSSSTVDLRLKWVNSNFIYSMGLFKNKSIVLGLILFYFASITKLAFGPKENVKPFYN